MFRTLRFLSAILLVGSVFVTTDLAINLAGALVPELQVDGIPFSSVLQFWFGLWEGHLVTRVDFFHAFATSAWISFALLAWNTVLAVVSWFHTR